MMSELSGGIDQGLEASKIGRRSMTVWFGLVVLVQFNHEYVIVLGFADIRLPVS